MVQIAHYILFIVYLYIVGMYTYTFVAKGILEFIPHL
jgi:hypothetical protein